MLTEKEKSSIVELAHRYRVKRIILFGSSTSPIKEGRDIDLAVEGLRDEDFFQFYGDLIFSLPKSVDLVDLSLDSQFTRMIQKEGIPIYVGHSSAN